MEPVELLAPTPGIGYGSSHFWTRWASRKPPTSRSRWAWARSPGRYLAQVNLLSAAAILVWMPVIVLSFVFRRQFIRGILSGSVKA